MADLNPSARQVLLDLADRAEREEPSKDLDGAIGYAVDATPKAKPVYKRGRYIGNKPVLIRIEAVWLPYTASLDAAVTLVPEGVDWSLQVEPGDTIMASVWLDDDGVHSCANSPALALCAASLRARAEAL
jgi:hypothetical protein